MNRLCIGFMICFLLTACSKKKENTITNYKPYIISYEDRKLKKYYDSLQKSNRKVPPPPKGFHSENQLIIDKNGNFYYYQKEYFRSVCGTTEISDTLPHFIDLKPKDIIKVPQTNLTDFLSENILTKENYRQILVIASQKDTIANTSFFDFLKTKNIGNYIIRRTTQEEDTVLKYKKSNHYYNSEDIKWNQNRITLPFVKPKI